VEINKEQEKFICQNYLGKRNKELTEMLNSQYKTNFTIKQVKWVKYKNKLNSQLVKRNEPLGSEKIKNGYIFVKIGQPQQWIEKQRYIYELAYGKIPKGCKVMFLDDDINNFNLDNLVLVKNSEALFVNKNQYNNHGRSIKETAINVARLHTKIKEISQENQK
jgi:hypothetical protein